MDGDHTLEQCCEVTDEVLRTVFGELFAQRVMLEGMVLKPNMVLPGTSCASQPTVEEVADATVNCFLRSVPAAVPAIAFLSGGQPAELASARLNAMNVRFKSRLPWALAFSFARAIQQPALEIWKGQEANVLAAQQALYHRARCNQAARAANTLRRWRRNDRKQAQPWREIVVKQRTGSGPYWRRMHRDWRFWVECFSWRRRSRFTFLSGDLAWVPRGHQLP